MTPKPTGAASSCGMEVADTQALKTGIQRLRNIEWVFDAYRITPTG